MRSFLLWGGILLLAPILGVGAWGQVLQMQAEQPRRVLVGTATPALSTATPQPTATAMPIEYSELARYTERYVGRLVSMGGEAIQVVEQGGGDYTLLVNVTYDGYFWDDTVMVDCPNCYVRPLEGDRVSFYAYVEGRQTYETVLGAQVTVPRLTAVGFSARGS